MSAIPSSSQPWILQERNVYLKRFQSCVLSHNRPDEVGMLAGYQSKVPINPVIYSCFVSAYQAMRENDRRSVTDRNTTAYPLYERVKDEIAAYVQSKRDDTASLERAAQRDIWTAELTKTDDKEKMVAILAASDHVEDILFLIRLTINCGLEAPLKAEIDQLLAALPERYLSLIPEAAALQEKIMPPLQEASRLCEERRWPEVLARVDAIAALIQQANR